MQGTQDFDSIMEHALPHTVDYQYTRLAQIILEHGTMESDPSRCSDNFISAVGTSIQLENTAVAFPLLLSKEVNIESIIKENLWFFRGETNIKTLGCGIWNEWADADGECGPIYGAQWRKRKDTQVIFDGDEKQRERGLKLLSAGYQTIGSYPAGESSYDCHVLQKEFDQLGDVIRALRSGSKSRRLIVDCWDVGNLDAMALPPCHYTFQFHNKATNQYHSALMQAAYGEYFERSLHLTVTMRSNDAFLGKPFNIAGYTFLLHVVARMCKMNIGSITINVGDDHIYEQHIEPIRKLMEQYETVIKDCYKDQALPRYPQLILSPEVVDLEDIGDLTMDHIRLAGYHPQPAIKGRVTV